MRGIVQNRMTSTIQKYVMEDEQVGYGLASWNGWLVWAHKHGHVRWLPYWMKRIIIGRWNRVVCVFRGHDDTELRLWRGDSGFPKERMPCCVHCSSPLMSKAEFRARQERKQVEDQYEDQDQCYEDEGE